MDSKTLVLAFSPAQLALLLMVAVLALVMVGRWALAQFQQGIEKGFADLHDEISGLRQEMKRHPTREEMHAEIDARVFKAQLRRRFDDESIPE